MQKNIKPHITVLYHYIVYTLDTNYHSLFVQSLPGAILNVNTNGLGKAPILANTSFNDHNSTSVDPTLVNVIALRNGGSTMAAL